MAVGDRRIDPKTGEPEIELADGSRVTDWSAVINKPEEQTSIAEGNTPYDIPISNYTNFKFLSFQTRDRRPEIDRLSSVNTFTKEDLTRDTDGWVYTNISTNEHQHTKETPTDYFFIMRTVIDPTLDTAVITLTETHATQDNTFGGVTGTVVSYDIMSEIASVTTARHQKNHDYKEGDPILEPNGADNFKIYTWTADEDFTTGDEDFDGTGFTAQEEAPDLIGLEGDIVNGNTKPKTFAGNSIAKAKDIIDRDNAVVQKFVPSAPVIQWGHNVGNGQIRTVISNVNGELYQVREGKTVTLQSDPSENLVEWVKSSDIKTPIRNIALADLQAITFEDLVGKTGLEMFIVDTEESVIFSQTSTAASVAPRKTYEPANYAVGQEGIGVWIVTSSSPPPVTLTTGRIYTNIKDQPVPDTNFNTYAVDLPDLQAGDEFTLVVARGSVVYDLTGRFLVNGQLHEFVFAGTVWRVDIVGTQFRLQALSGGGTQVVKAIFIER